MALCRAGHVELFVFCHIGLGSGGGWFCGRSVGRKTGVVDLHCPVYLGLLAGICGAKLRRAHGGGRLGRFGQCTVSSGEFHHLEPKGVHAPIGLCLQCAWCIGQFGLGLGTCVFQCVCSMVGVATRLFGRVSVVCLDLGSAAHPSPPPPSLHRSHPARRCEGVDLARGVPWPFCACPWFGGVFCFSCCPQ